MFSQVAGPLGTQDRDLRVPITVPMGPKILPQLRTPGRPVRAATLGQARWSLPLGNHRSVTSPSHSNRVSMGHLTPGSPSWPMVTAKMVVLQRLGL